MLQQFAHDVIALFNGLTFEGKVITIAVALIILGAIIVGSQDKDIR